MKTITRIHALAAGVAFALALPGFALAQAETRATETKSYGMEAERAGQSVADARKEATITTTYATNDHLRSTDIDVKVTGGTAVLTGKVESRVERELAERIAQSVSGITRVDNRLSIDPDYRVTRRTGTERDFGTAVSDATITAQVKSKLLWNTNTDGLDIDVDTRNGRVTLSGRADSRESRELAGRLASNTRGVAGVENKLTIAPDGDATARRTTVDDRNVAARDGDRRVGDSDQPVTDTWISTKVKSTLLFSRSVHGTGIEVDTHNGVVALKGTVDSNAEKQAAVELARDIRGVQKVDASALTVAAGERQVAADDRDDD
jgi:hyperosmotically inducible periplasmic protein